MNRAFVVPLLAGLLLGLPSGCGTMPGPSAAGSDLGQGWDQARRDGWYEGTQGSRLVPWSWAEALEAAVGTEPFFAAANMERLRFLPPEPTSRTGMPVGFVKDDTEDSDLRRTRLRWFAGQDAKQPWLGLNCSACHTAEITHQGQRLRVDGGPTMADFQGFVEDFDAALTATRADPAKLQRFSAAVLGTRDTPSNRTLLMQELDRLIGWELSAARLNGSDVRYGFARLDAFGRIYNKVALFANVADPIVNPADAPVSVPFLWNTHQADKVQWNAIADNKQISGFGGAFDYGALGRNVGEVTGVFGEVVVTRNPGLSGFHSSAQVGNLAALEHSLETLRPPAWPVAMFGRIDGPLAETGKDLFGTACARCHTDLARTDLTTKFQVKMSLFRPGVPGNEPPGTDPWMACNAVTYEAKTGDFEGTKADYVSGRPLGPVEPVVNMLKIGVTGTIAGQKGEVAEAALKTFLGFDLRPRIAGLELALEPQTRQQRLNRCMALASPLLGYKARPLSGIWATAPFLHNGSVPTLDDLLLPPAQRPTVFHVGGREYDPVKLGYRTEPSAANSFRFDVSGQGNANTGHDYGNARFTPADRRAILEYLKTL